MTRALRTGFALCACAAAACSGTGDGTGEASSSSSSTSSSSGAPDAGGATSSSSGASSSSSAVDVDAGFIPAQVSAPPVGPDAEARAEGTYTAAAQDGFALADGSWLFNTADGPLWQPAQGTARPLGPTLGQVTAATLLPEGLLIAVPTGLFVVTVDGLVRSPLSTVVSAASVRVLAADGPRLWLVTAADLMLLDNSRLFTVRVPGLSVTNAQVAFGSGFNNAPALWVRDGNTVWAVQHRQGQVEAWRVRDDLALQGMFLEGASAMVLWDSAGEFHVRMPSGRWYWYRAPAAFMELDGDGTASEAWMWGRDRAWVFSEGLFRNVLPAPAGEPFLQGTQGRVVMKDGATLRAYSIRRPLVLEGLPANGLVLDNTTVTVVPEDTADMVSVRYRLDGAGEVDIPLDTRQLVLNPNTLGVGSHVLDVSVAYGNGGLRASARAHLRVENTRAVTWTQDVTLLKETHCDRCHGTRGNAHVVTTREQWIAEFEDILDAAIVGRMPLNTTPLSTAEIAVLQDWKNAGFPE